ncbi:MAG: linear amide C-N hydrolase [Sodaliphilus sp.]
MKKLFLLVIMTLGIGCVKALACTGITLHTTAGHAVTARTIEWAGNDLESRYSIVPRGYQQQAILNDNTIGGLHFVAKYGYVGLAVQQAEFVVEGINEAGLAGGLFYFPGYGEYQSFDVALQSSSIGDLQVVPLMLATCGSIAEVKSMFERIHVVTLDPRGSTVHWRFTEQTGRQIVVEIINEKVKFYENTLGVLTNSPDFEWHLKNLNNYVNLRPGKIDEAKIGDMLLKSFGGGSGMHGIPGDVTPPSRFVRAAFYQTTAPRQSTTTKAVVQAFHILNNFDIPTGIQFADADSVPDIPSATQWTVATDLVNRKIYYRTMHNATIRCFDLSTINFEKALYQSYPLDRVKVQPIEMITVK